MQGQKPTVLLRSSARTTRKIIINPAAVAPARSGTLKKSPFANKFAHCRLGSIRPAAISCDWRTIRRHVTLGRSSCQRRHALARVVISRKNTRIPSHDENGFTWRCRQSGTNDVHW
eukprot:3188728-Rhodomonas_salina.2